MIKKIFTTIFTALIMFVVLIVEHMYTRASQKCDAFCFYIAKTAEQQMDIYFRYVGNLTAQPFEQAG